MRGRTIRYLRISLTDRCNLRCVYCMPPEGIRKIAHAEVLRYHEILSIVRIAVVRFGVEKVRVTGGEPLLRRGVCDFLADLCRIPGLRDVSLTTNGFFLPDMAASIHSAGIRRINVSLDTFRSDLFAAITGVDALDKTLRGIEAAIACGFHPVKINTVVVRENLDEIPDFVGFAKRTGVEVRFIERMPAGSRAETIPNSETFRRISEHHLLSPLAGGSEAGSSSVRYRIDGGPAVCGFISPMSGRFCESCDRIRLRADGGLIACLRDPSAFDLKPFLRPTLRAAALARAIERVVHGGREGSAPRDGVVSMMQVGG